MARLPGERYLIQQADGGVTLFEDFTERVIVRFDPADGNSVAQALETIRGSGAASPTLRQSPGRHEPVPGGSRPLAPAVPAGSSAPGP
jgi:hypothetical protein